MKSLNKMKNLWKTGNCNKMLYNIEKLSSKLYNKLDLLKYWKIKSLNDKYLQNKNNCNKTLYKIEMIIDNNIKYYKKNIERLLYIVRRKIYKIRQL